MQVFFFLKKKDLPTSFFKRIVTWNVWFKNIHQHARASELLRIVEENDPHILALQEITPVFLEILLSNAFIRAKYRVSDGPLGNTITPYGVLLLISLDLPPCIFEIHSMPSNMGRRLVTARYNNLTIGTVHLESLDNVQMREFQLSKCIFPVLQKSKYGVLMGKNEMVCFYVVVFSWSF